VLLIKAAILWSANEKKRKKIEIEIEIELGQRLETLTRVAAQEETNEIQEELAKHQSLKEKASEFQ
jgi:hypothetical protein